MKRKHCFQTGIAQSYACLKTLYKKADQSFRPYINQQQAKDQSNQAAGKVISR
ncbi:hypothetical protein [Neisseria sp. 83E34]|uniref:hypothetical protein n=1 Tax=Neisseria sp. 83E34 TaxID=1692264 RepID=UPI000B209319|nr:hypothetical protein [Neisseria sp. 83E34]